MQPDHRYDNYAIRTLHTDAIDDADRAAILALFHANYRDGNEAYVEKSLTKLRNVAIAMHGDTPAGFALGEMRIIDLPRLPEQTVLMAGMCCVAPEHRRRGLFAYLTRQAMLIDAPLRDGRVLSCGRMAHPVSRRVMGANPTVVPRPGVVPTPWQQEVGRAIAAAYGVTSFDPQTFVCIGDGRPIGYPVMDVEVDPSEWEVFAPVDRDRGDSLLGLAWVPDAPDGWLT